MRHHIRCAPEIRVYVTDTRWVFSGSQPRYRRRHCRIAMCSTRGLALERAQHELVAPQHVYTEPVDIVERVIEQRYEVGRVGERVRLTLEGALQPAN